jgi:hypothetical protein
MTSVRIKRIVLFWLGATFLILGGVASAVMSLVDSKIHVSTQIQTVTIEELQSMPLSADSSGVSGDNLTQALEPALLLPNGALRAALLEVDQPYWEVINRQRLGTVTRNWQTVLIQNHHKLDYTVIPEYARDWEWVRDGRKIKVQFHTEVDAMKDILSRKKLGKFAVQMTSLPVTDFPKALELLQLLVQEGHYAYLHRTEDKYEGIAWYRIRIGFFQGAEEAQLVGQEVFEKFLKSGEFTGDYWAVVPTSRELSRDLIDLQQPITKPWTIELPIEDSLAKASALLPKFIEHTDFSYLSQRFNRETNKLQFRIRVGFFETTGEARSTMYSLRNHYKGFRNARIVKL